MAFFNASHELFTMNQQFAPKAVYAWQVMAFGEE